MKVTLGSSFRFVALLFLGLFVVGLALVVSASRPGTPAAQAAIPASPNDTDVSIVENAFNPQTVTVTVGTTVRWTNNGSRAHSSTSNSSVWDSGLLNSGAQYSFAFNTPGTYSYFCTVHLMTAQVVVVADVSIVDNDFIPQSITVPAGTTVRWTNNGSIIHSSTSSSSLWDSGILNSGQQFSRMFNTPGTYPYYCSVHPAMVAQVVVQGPPVVTDVSMVDNAFIPQNITVTVGTTVEWTNNGNIVHSSTSDTGLWDSGLLNNGQQYSRTFNTPGTYRYHCSVHPEMVAQVMVLADVSMVDNDFIPQNITVTVGTAVQWTNNGNIIHSSTSDTGVWDSGILDPDEQYSFVFNTPGTYPYHCSVHPAMVAQVVVVSDVSIVDNDFIPQNITVTVGTTVQWTNNGNIIHSSTSDTGVWDSGILNSGQQYSRTFNTPGTYPYHCSVHPAMVAQVVVQGQSTSTPTNTPVPPTNTRTPTPAGIVNGHVDWQGVQAANRPLVTGTLTICVSGAPQTFPFTTNTTGDFSVATGLPNGSYNWMTRGGRHISAANTLAADRLVISGGTGTRNFALQRAGNTNADNLVNSTDFTNLKNQFGQSGQRSADADYNQVVNASDFTIQKNNFGQAGVSLNCS